MPEWKETVRERLRRLNLEGAREMEIVEELAQHLEDRYGELVAEGASEDEALRSVMDELGSHERLAEGLRKAHQLVAREPLSIGAGGAATSWRAPGTTPGWRCTSSGSNRHSARRWS